MMKTNSNRSILTGLVGIVVLAGATMSLQAATVYWADTDGNGGDGNWTDANVWYTTYDGSGIYSGLTNQPGEYDDVFAGQTSNASTITVNTNVGTINSLFLMHNNSSPRTVSNLIVDNGGTLDITTKLTTHYSNAGATSSITVNNGGSLTVGGLAALGIRYTSGFNFVQNGGTTQFNGGIQLNDTDNTAAVYEMKGGSMSAASLTFGRWNSSDKTAESARFEISGGSVTITGAVADAYPTVAIGQFPGTYQVIGTGATSISLGSMTLDAVSSDPQGASILSFLLGDATTGVTLTEITGAASFTDTVLQIGLMDGYDGADITGAGVTVDLLTATSITTSGMTLDQSLLPANRLASWKIVDGGNGQILQVTIIPEPSSLALLGLAGLALMRRRR